MRRLALIVGLILLPGVSSQEKKPEKKPPPTILLAIPLGVEPGKPTRITLRGLGLDTVGEVHLSDAMGKAKLLSKGKSAVPNMQDAKKIGDTQVEIEVTVPQGGKGRVSLTSPEGKSAEHALLLNSSLPVLAEKEPNDGFARAQPLPMPGTVDGGIQQAQDVDVFRIELTAGQRLVVEVLARKHGSALDPILWMHDASGRQLAAGQDRLEKVISESGTYLISVFDAHDQGGPAHVYRLQLRVP